MPHERAGDHELRRRAEGRLARQHPLELPRSEVDAQRLLHELEVHQVELEIQNEELRASRLEADRARLESERAAKRYAELYELAPLGYATLAEDATLLAINLAGASILGADRRAAVGQHFGLFFFDTERTAFDRFFAAALAGGPGSRSACELALTHRKEPRQVRLTATLLARTAPEVLLALEDVTERRRREEDLNEALQTLNVSQRVARLGSFVIDLATGAWTSSLVLDEILGIDARFERTKEGWRALVHPDDRQELTVHLEEVIARRDRLDRQYRIVRRESGEVRTVWSLGEIESDGAEPIRLVGTIQDVTERQRLLQERAELLRTSLEARAEAEAANRAKAAKDAFLATLSHELRNPLAPIRNSIFLLEKTQPGSEQATHALAVIDRQVRHLTRLVDDLLDVTRITRGKIHLQRRRLDLNDLARALIEDHRSLFERNGVRLELAMEPEPVLVEGDRDRLAQAVGNLLQNAAKFCSRGGTTLVAVARSGGGKKQAMLRVADDGVGMSPETLSRVFQPFMQADTTLDRSNGGLGLGMALAKGLVERHGGTISAHSEGLGKGSVFVVRLPLALGEPVEAPRGSEREWGRTPRRVLVIEDNVDAADSLGEVLALGGHEVAVAYSGHEGLAKVRELRPEIVLCDIGLPGMDGYEVARVIRADEALRGIYLVALTGYALVEDVRRAAESGFQRHMAKPPDAAALEQLLSEVPVAAH